MLGICANNNRNYVCMYSNVCMYECVYICMYVCITLGLEDQSYEGEEIALKLFLNLAKILFDHVICM